MDIYVVQPGDDIMAIANKYGVSVERLIRYNGLINPADLVPGQAIVILYPSQVHTVQAGDTISDISLKYGITPIQLLRNNPFLYDREYIFPGEDIVISFDTTKDVTTNGYAYYFINRDILKRTLPYLTFLSIFNYRLLYNGDIITYGDDTEIIQIAKDYNTLPLLMISALSPTGELNLEEVNILLTTEEYQDNLINNILSILRSKNLSGVNSLISDINPANQELFINVLTKVSNALNQEGYLFFITFNPKIQAMGDQITFEQVDYDRLSQLVYRLTFLQYIWGVNTQPPQPVSSITLLRYFTDYLVNSIQKNNISIGKPLIGYDWALPYDPGKTVATSLTLDSAIILAQDTGATIQLDEASQTPFFNYNRSFVGAAEEHIVWFLDARSFKALDELIISYDLVGSGVWNIMAYNQQIWSITNALLNIVKIDPADL